MANWNGSILTTAGIKLQGKVEAGSTKLVLTKLKVGDGAISGVQTLEGLTDLVSPKLVILGPTVKDNKDGTVNIGGAITNANLDAGFYLKEMGLFAQDPDVGEILYAITTDPNPDYFQAKGGATILSESLNMTIICSNASNVVNNGNLTGLLTAQALADHDANEKAHSNIFITADKDAAAADNSKKGATTSWVKNALAKFTSFTSSQISDFKSKVIEIMKEKAIEVLQITYKLESNGFIKFGLFGGFTIQWGVIEKYDELLQGGADFKSDQQSKLFPVAFVTKALALVVSDAGYYKNNTLYTGSTDVTGNVRGRIIDNSSFKVGLDYNVVGSHIVDIQWIAIGF